MKTLHSLMILAASCGILHAADPVTYVNKIYQFHVPSGVVYDASSIVASSGSRESDLEINPGGAVFELYAIPSNNPDVPPLATTYVGSYVPQSYVVCDSADPYGKDLPNSGTVPVNLQGILRRTRVDQPFKVYITTTGLLNGATDPEASKKVKLAHHVQQYQPKGTNFGIDPNQAILANNPVYLTTNDTQILSYTVSAVPGADRLKVRGEERFSVWTLPDNRVSGSITYQVSEKEIKRDTIQIWPVSDGTITGIANGTEFRMDFPTVDMPINDAYPSSSTYAQVYKGMPSDMTSTRKGVGVGIANTTNVPMDYLLSIRPSDLDAVIDSDGVWTLELVTLTPFGLERLKNIAGNDCAVWFNVNRTIKLNGTFTTIE